ncbi:MAG: AsmA family protein [Pseudomonadales bacterium]
MKAVKIILGIVLVLALIVAIGVFVFLKNINSIVKTAVETVGPQVTLTDVGLNAANIELQKGRAELNGLYIANPQGFSPANAFQMDTVVIDIDPASVTEDVIVINEVRIDGAKLLAEQKGLKDTNIQALMDNLSKSSSADESSEAEAESESDLRLMVEKLTFVNSTVDLKTEQLGDYEMPLPAINVANIGDKQTGLTPDELATALLTPVLQQVKKQVSVELQGKAKEMAKEKLQEELGKKISPEDQKKLEGLKGLLKGKK